MRFPVNASPIPSRVSTHDSGASVVRYTFTARDFHSLLFADFAGALIMSFTRIVEFSALPCYLGKTPICRSVPLRLRTNETPVTINLRIVSSDSAVAYGGSSKRSGWGRTWWCTEDSGPFLSRLYYNPWATR